MAGRNSRLFKQRMRREILKGNGMKYDYDVFQIEFIKVSVQRILYKSLVNSFPELRSDSISLIGPKDFEWRNDTKFYCFLSYNRFGKCFPFLLPIEMYRHFNSDKKFTNFDIYPISIVFSLDKVDMISQTPIILGGNIFFEDIYIEINDPNDYIFKHNARVEWCLTDLVAESLPPYAIFHCELAMNNIDFSAYDVEFGSEESNYKSAKKFNENIDKIIIPGYDAVALNSAFLCLEEPGKVITLCICPNCRYLYRGFLTRVELTISRIEMVCLIMA